MKKVKHRSAGFTLIELMVVVAIIGIIAAIALPSYLESVNKSRRGEAKAEMTTMAQQLERCFTRFNSYDNVGCAIRDGNTRSTDSGQHEITVTAGSATYSLIAAPQFTDGRCGSLGLDNTGTQTSSDNAYCW